MEASRAVEVPVDVATSQLVEELLRRIHADAGTVHVQIEAVNGVARRLRREFLTPGAAIDDRFPAIPSESRTRTP